MVSKTLVVLTAILLVLSVIALGISMTKNVPAASSTQQGKVMMYVTGQPATAAPVSTTAQVKVNVVTPPAPVSTGNTTA